MNCARQTRESGWVGRRKGQCDLSHAQPQISQNLVRWENNCKWHHVAPVGRVVYELAQSAHDGKFATDNRRHDFYGYDSGRYNLPANSARKQYAIEWPNRMILFIYRTCYFFINQKYAFYGRQNIVSSQRPSLIVEGIHNNILLLLFK